MNELDNAVSVLAAVALPLVGIGPVLLRTLPAWLVGLGMAVCAAVVLLLTREPWACAFTACIGAAVLLHHWRGLRGFDLPAHADERPRPVGAFTAARIDGDQA